MKQRLLFSLLFVVLSIGSLLAQFTPQGFNYQSIIRKDNGDPILNQTVTLLFSVRSGAPNGPVAYSEKHTTTTNEFGLINLVIGRGTALQNSFDGINWQGGAKFLTVALETTPNVFDEIGNSELLSVPYAMHSQTTDEVSGPSDNWGSQVAQTNPTLSGNGTNGNPLGIAQQGAQTGQILKWNGTAWAPATDNVGTNPGTVTLVNSGPGLIGGPITNTGSIGLPSLISFPSTYGSATQIPKITVDEFGRITKVETVIVEAGLPGIVGGTGINVQQSGSVFTVTNTGDTNAGDDLTNSSTAGGDISGTFSNLQVKADVVTTSELANNAVETANILNQAVTGAKIDDMGATNGQILQWNGTTWAPADNQGGSVDIDNGPGISITGTYPSFIVTNTGDTNAADDLTTGSTSGGDVTGPFSNLQLKADVVTTSELANNAVETANVLNQAITGAKIDDMGATNGQILKWNGTVWAPANETGGSGNIQAGAGIDINVSGNTSTIVNTGDTDDTDDITTASTANGDVSGPFSNLQLKSAVVTNAELASNAVGTANLINGSVTAVKLNNMGAATGQVLKWNGTAWAPANESGGGDNWGNQTVETTTLLGGDGTTASPLTISQLGATTGQVLRWSGTTWAPANVGNDNWGTQTVVSSNVLSGTGVTGSPLTIAQQGAATGQVLKWSGTAWAPANDVGGGNGDNWGTQSVETNATLGGEGTLASPLVIAQQGATNGQVLRWNGTAWLPATISGDNWGTQTAAVGAALTGNGTSGTPLNLAQQGATNGQVLRWSGTAWTPGTVTGDNWGTQTVVTTGTALTGSGTTGSQLRLAQQGATTGQVLKWNGTNWIPGTDNVGSGGITYSAGQGISIVSTGANTADIVNTGDSDNDKTNELQTLSLTGTILNISDASSPIDLAPLLSGSGNYWAAVTPTSNDIYFINPTGQVGIGVTAPAYPLDVKGAGHFLAKEAGKSSLLVEQETANAYAGIQFKTSGSSFLWNLQGRGAGNNSEFNLSLDGGVNAVKKVISASSLGNVGIGNQNNSNARLKVFHDNLGGFMLENSVGTKNWEFFVTEAAGTLQLFNNSSPLVGTPVGTFATNGIYTPSDARLKKDILDLPKSILDRVMSLRAVSYRYKGEADDATPTIGFLAQNVQQQFPELVGTTTDRTGKGDFLSLNYAGFGVIALKAIQEQQSEIQQLKQENDALRQQLQRIEERLKKGGM
jgi:hypothetical protein